MNYYFGRFIKKSSRTIVLFSKFRMPLTYNMWFSNKFENCNTKIGYTVYYNIATVLNSYRSSRQGLSIYNGLYGIYLFFLKLLEFLFKTLSFAIWKFKVHTCMRCKYEKIIKRFHNDRKENRTKIPNSIELYLSLIF